MKIITIDNEVSYSVPSPEVINYFGGDWTPEFRDTRALRVLDNGDSIILHTSNSRYVLDYEEFELLRMYFTLNPMKDMKVYEEVHSDTN